MREKLYVIDISNMMHRAFYVHKDLTLLNGFPIGAVHGCFSMLCTFAKRYKPQNMLICYDWQGEGSFRKSIYPGYKASRVKTNGISAQELILRQIFRYLGIATVEAEGYEADDLIATAVKKYKDTHDVIVVTGDKDLLQLIDDNVSVLDTMKNTTYGIEEVQKKFGVLPHQISDFLAIAGDKVDDIPGVKGVGKKGASDLLAKYDNLANIYDHINDISGALGKNMAADKDNAFLSRRLSNLYNDLPLDIDNILFKPTMNNDLLVLFEKLHFVSNTPKLHTLWKQYDK